MSCEPLINPSSPKPPPDSLCSDCQTITGNILLRTRPEKPSHSYYQYNEAGDLIEAQNTPSIPGIYHNLRLKDPAASVKTCAACNLFNKATYNGITLSEPTTIRLCLRKERYQVDVEDMVKVEREREVAERTGSVANIDGTGRVSIFTDFGTLAAQEFPGRTIGKSGSPESTACMKIWIKECDSNHPTCKLGLVGDLIADEPQMPTRVIDVGSFDGCTLPRLLETNGLPGKYIALSHSWGRVVKPYTTRNNIECSREAIDFENLPKTFQDCIFIARQLEIQYVWIDSICIIQDDNEDWKREAKTMGLVYEKAYLVISASESPGDHAGFLTPNPEIEPDVRLPHQTEHPSANNHVYLRGLYTWVIAPNRTSISQRGWVLQERTLSRRILHFDGKQVHWECSQYRVSECGDTEDVTSDTTTSYHLGQHIRPLIGGAPISDVPNHAERKSALEALYHFYACKVHEFSRCSLTYSRDKLPAILGLGEEIGRGTGIPYLEGHLRFEEPLFVYSLLWHTEIFSIKGSAFPGNVRAPSWTWAAMEGPRVFHLLGQDLKFERRFFLSIKKATEPSHFLLCQGIIVPCKKGEPVPSSHSNFSARWNHMHAHREIEEFKPPSDAHQLLDPTGDVQMSWSRRNTSKGWVCWDTREVRPEDVLFMPICAPLAGQENDHPETTRGCLGIVVVKVDVEEQNNLSGVTSAYRRVGFGGSYGTSWFGEMDESEFLLL